MRNRILTVAGFLVVVGLLALCLGSPPSETDGLPDAEPPSGSVVRTFEAPAHAPDEPLAQRPEVQPHSVAVGHSRLAEDLGLIATRCWVGSEFDSESLVGEYHQFVENGWYSHVESSLEGVRDVERRFKVDPEGPDDLNNMGIEVVFMVKWKAERPGETVVCTVRKPKYAELTVVATDLDGQPVADARVGGCDGMNRTDADGRATWRMVAEEDCSLRAFTSHVRGSPMLYGQSTVKALQENERRTVKLEMTDEELERPAERKERESVNLVATLDTYEDQLRHFSERAATATGSEADLYERLAKHRQRMLDWEAESEEKNEALDDLLEDVAHASAAGEPLEVETLHEEIMELVNEPGGGLSTP